MDSIYLSQHLSASHEEIIDLIEYFDNFIDHPAAKSHEIEWIDGENFFYTNISLSFLMGICLKLDLIEMFDPLVMNYAHQLLVS